MIFSLFDFQLKIVVEHPPFDDAWKPNAAVLTWQTFISVISDPNPTFCMIFSLFHFQLKIVVENPPYDDAWRANAAVSTRQTLNSVHCTPEATH